jgi:hypothetical protein
MLPLSLAVPSCRTDNTPLMAHRLAGAAAFFHFLGKLPHGFLGDHAAFTASKGSSGIVERQEKFRALPFAVFPQRQGLLHGVLFGAQPSAFNRAAGESSLIRGKVHAHRFQGTEKPHLSQAARQSEHILIEE